MSPAVMEIYIQNVFDEIAEDFWWMFDLEDEESAAAMAMFADVWFARAKSANARVLGQSIGTSKDTIYRMRKRGNVLLDQLDRIENHLEHQAAMDELRWAELFQRLNVGESEGFSHDDEEAATKP